MSFVGWLVWLGTGIWFVVDCYQKRFRAKSESYTPNMASWVFIAERFFILLFFLFTPVKIWHIIWAVPLAKYGSEPLARKEVPMLSGFFLWLSNMISIVVLAGTGRRNPRV